MHRFTPQLPQVVDRYPLGDSFTRFASEASFNYARHLGSGIFARQSRFGAAREEASNLTQLRSKADVKEKLIGTLSAPTMIQDYYANLLEFTADDHLVCALGSRILLYNMKTKTSFFCGSDLHTYINYVRAHPSEKFAAIATTKGSTLLWDLETGNKVSQFPTHGRTTTLDLSEALLAQGNRCGYVNLFDVRERQKNSCEVKAHADDVCALRFSPSGDHLLVTGGLDKALHVYDTRSLKQVFWSQYHTESVKAVAWSPFVRGLLATGAGIGDQHIVLWDLKAREKLCSRRTQGQVCNLEFVSRKALVSTFGWPVPSVQFRDIRLRVASTNNDHKSRVLYLALDKRKTHMATGAADKKIKLWKIQNTEEASSLKTPSIEIPTLR